MPRFHSFCCQLCSRHLQDDGTEGKQQYALCGQCAEDYSRLAALYSKIVNRFPQYKRLSVPQLFEKMWAGINPNASELEKRFPNCQHNIPLSTECAYCTAEIEKAL